MSNARVADAGQMTGGGLLSVEVPDRFVGIWEVVGQETAAIHLGEDSRVPPALSRCWSGLLRHRAEIEDVDDEEIPRLGALHPDGTAKDVASVEADISYVVCRVIVAYLTVRPFAALHPELVAGFDFRRDRDVRVPPIVARNILFKHRFRLVNMKCNLRHYSASLARLERHYSSCVAIILRFI